MPSNKKMLTIISHIEHYVVPGMHSHVNAVTRDWSGVGHLGLGVCKEQHVFDEETS